MKPVVVDHHSLVTADLASGGDAATTWARETARRFAEEDARLNGPVALRVLAREAEDRAAGDLELPRPVDP